MSKYDKASLVQIPSGYKANKLYSVLPVNGDGDFTFTRTSTGTRVNKDGYIETVATGEPRLDYPLIDGVVQDCPSLLLEPSRTNLQTYSSDLASVYVPTNITQTSNYGVSPDGTLTSTRVVLSNLTDSRSVETLTGVLTNGIVYTFSCYYKGVKGESTYMYFLSSTGGVNASKKIVFTGEWQRESITFTAGSASNYTYIVDVRQGISNATDFEVWGAQVEAGSYATSYIPTTGSSVTRSAETCNSAGNASTFNDSEGVLMAEISALADDGTVRSIALSDGTGFNRINIRFRSQSNEVEYSLFVNGETTKTITHSVSDTTNFHKMAALYKKDDLKFYVNGFLVGSFVSANMLPTNTLNQLNFDSGAGLSDLYGKTKEIAYFDSALTDIELEDLTSWDSFKEMAQGQLYIIE